MWRLQSEVLGQDPKGDEHDDLNDDDGDIDARYSHRKLPRWR